MGVIKIYKRKYDSRIVMPAIVLLIYTIYFYLISKLFINHDLLISISDITVRNIGIKFVDDFLAMLFFPLVIIMVNRKKLTEFKLQFTYSYLLYTLTAIMLLLFLLHRDFTVKGYYKFFFYLVVIGFGEEFMFRGYAYNRMAGYNKMLAVIISGLFWGIMHSILPGLLAGRSPELILTGMISEIGGGIAIGYYYIYLMEKSQLLFVPILVHSIMDYSISSIAIIIAVGAGIYLFAVGNSKKIT